MGYRSEVILAIKGDVFINLDKKDTDAIKEAFDESGTKGSDHYFYSNQTKWADFYEEIRVVEELLTTLDSSAYGFIRIGEDLEDTCIEGTPSDFGLYAVRMIEKPAGLFED